MKYLLLALLIWGCKKSTPTETLHIQVMAENGSPLTGWPGGLTVSLYEDSVLFQTQDVNGGGIATFGEIPVRAYNMTVSGKCGAGMGSVAAQAGVSGAEIFFTDSVGCVL